MADIDPLVLERTAAEHIALGQANDDSVWAAERPLRVLMVHEAGGGGSGRQVLDLSEGLLARGHRVSLAYSGVRAEQGYLDRATSLGFETLVDLEMRREVGLHDFRGLLELRKFINRTGPYDIVHAHSSKAGALARLAGVRGAARIYTPHAFRTMDPALGSRASRVYGAVETLLGRAATEALIAVGPEEHDHAIALGVRPEKVRIVLNGVAPFTSRPRDQVRRELGLGKDKIAIGFVGRLSPQKDPVRFCQAIARANAAHRGIVGVIVGDGELSDAVRDCGAPVIMLGHRNAREYLSAFDALAVTSRYEGFPYVLLEALQSGLPIVSTDVGGARSVVRDDINGRIVPVDAAPELIAQALLRLSDPTDRRDMARHSRELAHYFSIARMVEETERVYEGALLARPLDA